MDARGRAAFEQGTVAGAVDAGRDPAGFLAERAAGRALLVVPWPPHTGLDWQRRLEGFGLEVHLIDGGFEAWVAAGLPVEVPRESRIQPGQVPFIIPRGLCEMNEPAKRFE